MEIFGIHVGALDDVEVASLAPAAPTYDHVGSTLSPDGRPQRLSRSLVLGTGATAFEAGREALRTWVPQRGLGASIRPDGVRPDLGETVLLDFGVLGRGVVIPTRIVAVVDEPGRYGFAYGTLPGHPETGEQLFLVEHRPDGEVVMTCRIDAEPSERLRAVRPLVRLAQRAARERYLRAVRARVRSETGRR